MPCTTNDDCKHPQHCCVRGECINVARQPIFVSPAAPDCKARTTSSTFALQAAPFLAAQQMFLVPLDRYEKGVQDALLGGGPLDAETAQALGLAPEGRRSEGLILDKGRGVGLLRDSAASISHISSSKGLVLKRLIEHCRKEHLRCVVFTHLSSLCGVPAIRNIFQQCGVHAWQANGPPAWPFERYAYVDSLQQREVFAAQEDAFNNGETAFLLARDMSEGVQFEHVQLMVITEPTGSAVTWVQEIARVARLKTYQGERAYDLEQPHGYAAKVPHVIQLVSQGTAPGAWARGIATAFGLFAASSLILTITSLWTLVGKRLVRNIPAHLTPAQQQDSLRVVREMQTLSQKPGMHKVAGLRTLSASPQVAAAGLRASPLPATKEWKPWSVAEDW